MKSVLSILVAEDNDDDVFFLEEAFKRSGATSFLHRVRDGVEAQEYLKGYGAFADRVTFPFPDILLLDLNLPRMDGFELLEWLRQDDQCSKLTVHALTASARESDVERAHKLHVNSYIIKPSRLDELVAFVSALQQWHNFAVLPRAINSAGLLMPAG